ncbi:MAG: DUF1028 domain-containing protein [Crocinitomicaceae bacterium]|jgi:uncharacterized Ntn-hydrolase superfamily protein|nr:DUF1028 domain-containing protein [Crocinitomicaceae bacterium]
MKQYLLITFSLFTGFYNFAQDTFSIVAVDTVTGEVGSAGASCVDLIAINYPSDDFLGQLIPGVGAINTQASYNPSNQNTARQRMLAGDTPDEIIQYMINNDIQGTPGVRQYGVSAIINNGGQSAAFTGANTMDYKNHITGPNYSIQGNILLGQQVLDSMEARFNREEGDLACKLMAALQGANIVGADSRCASNGTSSLFAFVKVSQPTDTYGNPSFLVSVRTSDGAGIEPIDSLQTKFSQVHHCGLAKTEDVPDASKLPYIYPNPVNNILNIPAYLYQEEMTYEIISMDGKSIQTGTVSNQRKIDTSKLKKGSYLLRINSQNTRYSLPFKKE